jgi:hypothetical protein
MAALDITAQVKAWAVTAVSAQAFGEDFGVDAAWAVVPAPAGAQVLFTLLVTMRSPLLGQGPLFCLSQLATPQPTQDQVEQAVAEQLRQLRELSRSVLAQGNGTAEVPRT